MAGPEYHRRDAQPALEQFRLYAGEGPSVREAFAAVVTSEDNNRVLGQPIGVERLPDTADLQIHLLDHALIRVLGAPIEVAQIGSLALRLGFIARRFPRPVRRIEMETDQEWLRFGIVEVDARCQQSSDNPLMDERPRPNFLSSWSHG